jgi:hypothetical protein
MKVPDNFIELSLWEQQRIIAEKDPNIGKKRTLGDLLSLYREAESLFDEKWRESVALLHEILGVVGVDENDTLRWRKSLYVWSERESRYLILGLSFHHFGYRDEDPSPSYSWSFAGTQEELEKIVYGKSQSDMARLGRSWDGEDTGALVLELRKVQMRRDSLRKRVHVVLHRVSREFTDLLIREGHSTQAVKGTSTHYEKAGGAQFRIEVGGEVWSFCEGRVFKGEPTLPASFSPDQLLLVQKEGIDWMKLDDLKKRTKRRKEKK